jgi:hypothetical protein
MKRKKEKLDKAPSQGAVKIVCDQWLVEGPVRVTIWEEPQVRLFPITPGFVALKNGSNGLQVVSLEDVADGTLRTNLLEEYLC